MIKNIILLLLLSRVPKSLQDLLVCDDLTSESETQFCKASDSVAYPPNFYTIQPTIDILDVSEINEDKKTITVYFQFFLGWNDTVAQLYLADNDKPYIDKFLNRWYNIHETKNVNEILKYSQTAVKFINSQTMEKTKLIDVKDSFYYLWHLHPYYKEFSEDIKLTFSCDFDFEMFPFDKHKCYLRFFNPYYAHQYIKLTPTRILVNSSSTNVTKAPLLVQTSRLSYKVTVESIPLSFVSRGGIDIKSSGIVIILKRNDIGQLIGGFFWPTGIFTIISLVSFLINPDIVPGRLGMLLTVFLIITNNYNSLNAPHDRGFSFIEIWMVGIYFQIIFAIFEYAYLISQNRNKIAAMYPNDEQDRIKELSKKLDGKAMIFSLIYFILFQCTYWSIVNSLE